MSSNNCIRCDSSNIIIDPIATKCNNCKCHSFYVNNDIIIALFTIHPYYIRIDFLKNKTYINKINNTYSSNSLEIDIILPMNISVDKLMLYCTFS